MFERMDLDELGLSDQQLELAGRHGTPAEFAAACYAAVPGYISMDEAAEAIAKYGAEWERAHG